MEIALLCFSAGVVVAMLIAAFSDRLINVVLFSFLPLLVIALWYFWATNGVQYFLKEIISNNSSVQRNDHDSDQKNKPDTKSAEEESEKLLSALGQTGDLFGGINALFAALAFAGVAVAAMMQARSLQLAREQQLQQSFEPLFFHLLELHRGVSAPKFKLRSRLNPKGKGVVSPDGTEQAVDFSRAMSVLRRALRMKAVGLKKSPERGAELAEECAKYYRVFYTHNQDELGPHFRTLFHIFKLIDTSKFDMASKIKYANIARSTLGRDQLFLLAVNCLSIFGKDFKPYVEKYGLLKHITSDIDPPTIDENLAAWCYHANARLGAEARLINLKK